MSNVIYKNISSHPIMVVGGQGVWLHDNQGNRYLDTCSGVAVSSLGHCHPRIIAAFERESKNITWAHAGSFTTEAAEELAHFLVESSNGLAKAQFLSGGSEAMELSLKVAYQYHCERGNIGKSMFISRRQSFHGSSLGTLAISGNKQRRSIFEPLLQSIEFVSPCYAYRDKHAAETDTDYAERLALELESKIQEIGSDKVAGFIAEPVVGSTNGAVPAVPGYFKKIREVCTKYDVLLILDEIMSGIGRTGHLFSYLEDDILPDIVATGKGLAAGYQPISAMLITSKIHSAIELGSGILRNGQTHVNHPLACAIALEVQKTIKEGNLLENVNARGAQLRKLLTENFADYEFVGDVRGRGMFLGIEFVRNKQTKEAFMGGDKLVATLKNEALKRNLLIYPGTGTVDGISGNHILIAPPFISTEPEIEEMVDKITEVVKICLS